MMKYISKTILMLAVALSVVLFTSCEGDDSLTQQAPEQTLIEKAQEFLSGDIVLNTKATKGGIDKTLLPSGCPTKFNFTWNEEGKVVLALREFHVGSMPFSITFLCPCKIMKLNYWEKNDYPGDSWIKFFGQDGNVSTNGSEQQENQQGSGASVQGYFNVDTHEIEFIVDYNIMLVRTETLLQKVNKSRTPNFEEEFAQYEKDLAEYKKEHGYN